MNHKRRDLLKRAEVHLDQASGLISRARDEEQDALDNCPENLEGSDRHEKMETAVEKLEEALDLVEEARGCVGEAGL